MKVYPSFYGSLEALMGVIDKRSALDFLENRCFKFQLKVVSYMAELGQLQKVPPGDLTLGLIFATKNQEKTFLSIRNNGLHST